MTNRNPDALQRLDSSNEPSSKLNNEAYLTLPITFLTKQSAYTFKVKHHYPINIYNHHLRIPFKITQFQYIKIPTIKSNKINQKA